MRLLCLCLLCTFIAPAKAHAQEWTRFRGPNGSGISTAKTVPVTWNEEDYNWQIDLPGQGHSSPVLWGEKLFLTSADVEAGERYLICIDANSGKTLWQHGYSFAKHKKHKNNSFASSTPAVDAKHVYMLWQSRETSSLVAVDHDGKDAWTYDLGPFQGGHGGAISPIVYREMVILGNDHEGHSSLLAVECQTGEVRWQTERRSTRATYATPCVFQPEGRAEELVFTDWEQGISGIDPQTGNLKWEIGVFGSAKQRAIGSPVVVGDLVIGTCGFVTADKHAVAVRPYDATAAGNVKEVFRIERAVPHIPTPLVFGKLLFLWSEKGIVTCVDAATGEQHWQQRVGGNFSGSPVCVDGKLYAVDDSGTVVVLAAASEFEELARNDLGELSRSTPAVAGGVMYLRTTSKLFSIGGE